MSFYVRMTLICCELKYWKANHSKEKVILCKGKGEAGKTLRIQGGEGKEVQEFQYLGSTTQSNGSVEWIELSVAES